MPAFGKATEGVQMPQSGFNAVLAKEGTAHGRWALDQLLRQQVQQRLCCGCFLVLFSNRQHCRDPFPRQVGTRNNCTFCGVFRRQALDRGATLMKADKVGAAACVCAAEFSNRDLLVRCPYCLQRGLCRVQIVSTCHADVPFLLCFAVVTQVATGHNADDMAETILLNMLRGDVAR